MFIRGLPCQPAISPSLRCVLPMIQELFARVEREVRYNQRMATIDIGKLSFEDRLRLLDELWESLSRTPEAIPLTGAQREELDRLLDELDREGPVGIPWDEVLGRIRGRAQ